MNSITVYLSSSIGRVSNNLLYYMSSGLHLLENVYQFGNSQLIASNSLLKDPWCFSWKYFSWRHFKICFLLVLPNCIFKFNSSLIWWYSIKHWKWNIYNSSRNNTYKTAIHKKRSRTLENVYNIHILPSPLLQEPRRVIQHIRNADQLVLFFFIFASLRV